MTMDQDERRGAVKNVPTKVSKEKVVLFGGGGFGGARTDESSANSAVSM